MNTPLTFSQYIESDYDLFKKILYENNHFDCDSNEKFRLMHSNIYKFKELVSSIVIRNEIKTHYLESLNGQIEFIWLLSLGKYKLASMALRGALETFSQGLMTQFTLDPSQKFSENIDRSIKETITSLSTYKLHSRSVSNTFGTVFRSLLLDPVKNSYWNLCDIVHSRNQLYNSCQEFLEEVLRRKYDDDQTNELLTLAISITEYILIIFFYSNYALIIQELNPIKLDLIVSNFSSVFDAIKTYTL